MKSRKLKPRLAARAARPVAIDGLLYHSVRSAARAARTKGATTSIATLCRRIHQGATTMVELLRPPAPSNTAVAVAKTRARRRTERNEMVALVAELDARKAQLAAGDDE